MPDDGLIIHFEKGFFTKVKRFENLDLVVDGSRVFFGDEYAGDVINGDFPNWRKVLPAGKPKKINEIGLDPNLLKDFSFGKYKGVRLVFHSATDPIDVYNSTLPEFHGLLMPYRI